MDNGLCYKLKYDKCGYWNNFDVYGYYNDLQVCLLSIVLTNAFGLYTKMGGLQNLAAEVLPDLIVVTETKFTEEKVTQAEASLPGYATPLRKDRTAHGGGVAI